jgi:nucleoporin NUP1
MDPRSSVAPSSLPPREASVGSTPSQLTFPRASTWQPPNQPSLGPIARDYSMPAAGSVSPTRSQAPFRMRSSFSMTPQPSGQSFGPTIHKREPSEPPSLSVLRANPVFVRPPSQEPDSHRRSVSVQPVLTLGTIAEQVSDSLIFFAPLLTNYFKVSFIS